MKITGDKQLISQLEQLKKVKAKAAVRKGSRAGSKLVAAAAKEMAPVRTGQLRQGMKVRSLPRSRKWTGTMVTTSVKHGSVFYQGFVELGTKFIKARKFLRNAFQRVKSSALSAFIEGIREEINQ